MIAFYCAIILLSTCSLAVSFALSGNDSISKSYSKFIIVIQSYAYWFIGLGSLVVIVHCIVWQKFSIPSKSMLPNYPVNSVVHVNPSNFGIVNPFTFSKIINFEPELGYGDVVIARFPYSSDVQYIKRIVALPLDIISIDNKGISINNVFYPFQLVADDYIGNATHSILLKGRSYQIILDKNKPFKSVTGYQVPEDSVYLLGDNLTGSVDSRHIGAFKLQNLLAIEY